MLGISVEPDSIGDKQQPANNQLGSSVNAAGNLKISSSGGRAGFETPEDILNAENSGTTIRLLTSMCSFVNAGFTVLTGDKSLRKRPMGDLTRSLNQLGVDCFSSKISNTPPLIVRGGGMTGGEAIINGQISSQFVSSLLLSSIYAKKHVTIKILGKQVSKPYITSTISIMKKFGIEIKKGKNGSNDNAVMSNSTDATNEAHSYSNFGNINNQNIPVTDSYDVPNEKDYLSTDFRIPGDFSTAALLLSTAILTDGELTIDNVDFSLPQGDSDIINILKKLEADIIEDKNNGTIKVTGTKLLDGGEFDLKDTPDLLPVVSILSLKCKKSIKITGISHARYKETDRVANIATQLAKFGAEIKEDFDSITIHPPKKNQKCVNKFI